MITLFLLLLALPSAHADDCLDPARVQSQFRDVFRISSNDPLLKLDFCDKTNVVHNIASSFFLLNDLPRLSAVSDAYDQGILGDSLPDYFRQRVQTIHFEHSCDEFTVAFVSGSPVMHVCPYAANLTALGNADTLLHEARHLDPARYRHVDCTDGRSRSCDPSYAYRGSYAVSAEFNVKVARTESLSPAMRQEARSEAIFFFLNTFNEMPLGLRSGVKLQAEDGGIFFYDGKKLEKLFSVDPGAVTIERLNQTLVFTPGQPLPLRHTYGTNWREPSQFFRGKLRADMGENPGELVDVYYNMIAGQAHACYLFADSVRCSVGSAPARVFRLAGFKPLSILYGANALSPDEARPYIADTEGFLYPLPYDDASLENWQEGDFKKSGESLNLKGLGYFGGQQLGLTLDGRAVLRNAQKQTSTAPPGIPAQMRFQRVVGTSYYSSTLETL